MDELLMVLDFSKVKVTNSFRKIALMDKKCENVGVMFYTWVK